VGDVFQLLADPTRRRLVEGLAAGERSVGDLVAVAGIGQPGVSRQLAILQDAGFVSMRPDGRRRLYALRSDPFDELDRWMRVHKQVWEARLDRLGAALASTTRDAGGDHSADEREKGS